MRQPFTTGLRLLLLALALGTGYTSRGQTYTPVALTGFTQDIIANGPGAVSATTTADIDGGTAAPYTGYCLMAQDYVGPTGQVPNTTAYPAATYPALETSGLFTSALNSAITFQLAPYSANNALRLAGAAASGTLTFATPSPASELYVIGTSGNAASSLDVTVTFADGTTQVFTGQVLPDWFATTSPTTVVREKLGRVSRADNAVQYTGSPVGPRLYQLKLTLLQSNITKNIASISFTKALAAGNAVILAATAGAYPVCAATPTNLSTTATTSSGGSTALTSACASTSIYLAATGLPSAATAGYTYQWQSSTTSATTGFSNISGATGSTYTATGQAATTWYRVVVACLYDGAGGTAVNSTAVQVTQNPATSCYCTPTASTGCGTNGIITSVAITGTPFSSSPGCISATSPGYVSAYYASFVGAGTPTATLVGNTTYTITGTVGRTSRVVLWIDYDQSGTFDASEYTQIAYNTATTAATYSATFLVPATALGGTTRLRIRSDISSNTTLTTVATAACATTTYGESLDYAVTITPAAVCTGTPPVATVAASLASACSGTAFTLTATAQLAGTTGYSYQWQSSPAGANTFTNLGAAQTTATYSVASQVAATDYRVIVTCTGSGLTSTSGVVSVAQNPFYYCYCTPVTAGAGNDGITNVTLGTLNNTSSTTNSAPYYTDYTPAQLGNTLPTPVLTPGGTATVAVKMGSDAHQFSGVWLDFDHSGTFDTGEFFTLGTDAGASGTSVIPITIPSTALAGLTKLRVRGGDDVVLLSTQACTAASSTSNYGEVEDYFVNIAPTVACAGTLPATTATATVSSACTATPGFTLGVTGLAAGITGVSYQWQSSPTGANTFTNLGTAQPTPAYAITSQTATLDYRVVVTCTASGSTSTSGLVTVAQQATCYCAPVSTGTNEYIESFTLPGFNGLTNASYINSPSGYGDYTTVPGLTTTLNQGATYPNGVSLTIRANNTGSQGGLWIDYDHSGTFDASEYTLIGTSSASATDVTLLATLAVPATALTGPTRARVRWRNGSFAGTDACTTGLTTWYGETEDYLITIAPACTPSTATFSYGSSSYCVSGTTSPAATLASGATAGTFSSTTGLTINATTGAITLSSSTPGTYTVTNTVAGTTAQCNSSATATVTINAAPTAGFSYPATTVCAGSATTLTPALTTGATAGTYSLPTTTGLTINATTGVVTVATTAAVGTYTVTNTVAAANGCAPVTATATFTITSQTTATFSYPAGPYCVSGTTSPAPAVTGTAGGTFSSTTGLTINATTGAVTLSSSTPGTYTVTYTVAGTCGSSSTQSITLNAAPTASFSYGSGPYCVSGTTNPAVTLASGATAGTFSSATGLTLNATTGAITLSSSTAGTYTVTNTVAAANGCAQVTATATVTITAAPTASFAYPTRVVCAGSATTLTPALATGATAGTYSLPTATGLSISAMTGVVTVATTAPAGTYAVTNTVAASGGCAASTSTATFTVTAAPATPTLTTSGTPATGILLTSSAPTGNQFYLNGTAIAGATNQTYLINSGNQNGSYTVTATNAAGCSATSAAVAVTVTATASAQATPTLTLYPNPTRDGQLTLELSGYQEAVQLQVINALGQRVYETTLSGSALTQKQKLNLAPLSAGVYLLQVRTASGSLQVRRFVREL